MSRYFHNKSGKLDMFFHRIPCWLANNAVHGNVHSNNETDEPFFMKHAMSYLHQSPEDKKKKSTDDSHVGIHAICCKICVSKLTDYMPTDTNIFHLVSVLGMT